MSRPTSPSPRLRDNQRRPIVTWLFACAIVLAGLFVLGVMRDGAGGVVRTINRRWPARLAEGEALVAAGRYEAAAAFLERLDRRFPATWVKHRFSRQRELLLELLGTSQTQLGRRADALETYRRLVEFDPRNWWNHFLLGEACRSFGALERAQAAYADVLAIHPNHLASVEALIGTSFRAGRHRDVTQLYEAYLDAWLLARGTLRLGSTAFVFEFPVDGFEHARELPANVAAGWGGDVCLETGGYSVRIETLELVEPLRVGTALPAERVLAAGGSGWNGRGAAPAAGAAWSAQAAQSSLCTVVPDRAVARVRMRLTAYKALSPELWELVQASYTQCGEDEALEQIRARSLVGGWPDADERYWPPRPRSSVLE